MQITRFFNQSLCALTSLCLASSLLLSSCLKPSSNQVSTNSDSILQDIKVEDLKARMYAKDGQLKLVNFWATWCDPCKEELPYLVRLSKEFKEKGFQLILVSADQQKYRQQAEEFLKKTGVDFSTYIKTESDQVFLSQLDKEWNGALPASLLIDGQGQLSYRWDGKAEYDDFKKQIIKHLTDTSSATAKEGS